MHALRLRSGYVLAAVAVAAVWLLTEGCQFLSNRLTRWDMLGQDALEDPVKAVGGRALVFVPGPEEDRPRSRQELAAAAPADLVAYYAPVIVQQRIDSQVLAHPYPPEYDTIGEARLRREGKGKYKAFVAGPPTIYAIYQKVRIEDHDHVQLTYTAWYPAHPRLMAIDLEEADIDSCVLRLTLDADNAPLFYETIAACGAYHKVFVEKWIEEAAARQYGAPEAGKKFAIERSVKDAIEWEVAGVVDGPREQPRRPTIFIEAGDHHVIGMGSTARLRLPERADVQNYALTDYADLYSLPVEDTEKRAPFFDLGKGGIVWGAERKERFIMGVAGVDRAGQPRANDQIKLHFDQTIWSDPTIYARFLRLPAGAL